MRMYFRRKAKYEEEMHEVMKKKEQLRQRNGIKYLASYCSFDV